MKFNIIIPRVPDKAEFPLIFLLIFLPGYMTQRQIHIPLFDSFPYQAQIILQSLLIFLLVRYLLERRTPQHPWVKTALEGSVSIVHSLLVFLGLTTIYLLFTLGIIAGQNLFHFPPPDQNIFLTKFLMLIPAFFTCLAAAAMEEFFFRGYAWFRLCESGVSEGKALVIISLLFALGHLYEGSAAAILAFVSALFLGFMLKRGISLFSLSLAHGIFNFIMLVLSGLKESLL